MKTLIFNLLVVSLVLNTVLANAQSSSQAQRSKAAQTNAGGGDTGGGNATPYLPRSAQESEIANAIKLAVPISSGVLNALEINLATQYLKSLNPQAGVENILQRVFKDENEQRRIELRDVKYFIQAAPCMHYGVPNDASWTGSQICFSMDRLKVIIKKESIMRQLVSLSVHELTHALGERHPNKGSKAVDEIKLLQDFIFANVFEDIKKYAENDELSSSLQKESQAQMLDAQKALFGPFANPKSFCFAIEFSSLYIYLRENTRADLQFAEQVMFSRQSRKELAESVAIGILANNSLSGFCNSSLKQSQAYNINELLQAYFFEGVGSFRGTKDYEFFKKQAQYAVDRFSQINLPESDILKYIVKYQDMGQMISVVEKINELTAKYVETFEQWSKRMAP